MSNPDEGTVAGTVIPDAAVNRGDPLAVFLVRVVLPPPQTEDSDATRDAPTNAELEKLIEDALGTRLNLNARAYSERVDK